MEARKMGREGGRHFLIFVCSPLQICRLELLLGGLGGGALPAAAAGAAAAAAGPVGLAAVDADED